MLNHPEATAQALAILRTGDLFQWVVITLLALTVYVYTNEYSHKNWKGIAAGLSLYLVHWFYEILNALIQRLHRPRPLDRSHRNFLSAAGGCRDRVKFYVRYRRGGSFQDPSRRPEIEDPGNKQPHRVRNRECGFLLRRRDLPGENPDLRLDLPLVGSPAGFHFRIYPLLCDLISLLRLAAQSSENIHPQLGGC